MLSDGFLVLEVREHPIIGRVGGKMLSEHPPRLPGLQLCKPQRACRWAETKDHLEATVPDHWQLCVVDLPEDLVLHLAGPSGNGLPRLLRCGRAAAEALRRNELASLEGFALRLVIEPVNVSTERVAMGGEDEELEGTCVQYALKGPAPHCDRGRVHGPVDILQDLAILQVDLVESLTGLDIGLFSEMSAVPQCQAICGGGRRGGLAAPGCHGQGGKAQAAQDGCHGKLARFARFARWLLKREHKEGPEDDV
mmetsp:Transcript_25963/g.57297  ORF Transcript_25963/g.57297 Transcript_25963/m.57297 type:complete len:252 (-) Transcript_25963:6-761(-)